LYQKPKQQPQQLQLQNTINHHQTPHTVSDTSSVSEDKPILVAPLQFAKLEINPTNSDVLMLEA